MSDYRGFRIKHIHAIVHVGDDDEEGICSQIIDGMNMPLIAADKVRLHKLIELAQQVADATGLNFEIVRFTAREHVGEIKSRTRQ